MGTNNILPSHEFGLAMGLLFGRFSYKMEDLHYGYWTDDLPVDIQNLPKAQAQFTELLISKIPQGVKRILDVGCATATRRRSFSIEGTKLIAFLQILI